MTDSPTDPLERQPLPPAYQVSSTAQFAAVGMLMSGALAIAISGLFLCLGLASSGLMFSLELRQGPGFRMDPWYLVMTGVGLVFSLSYILPILTGAGSVYGGLLLHKGGSARRIRMAAIASVIGYAFLIIGAIPGLVLGGCTSGLLLLTSPFTAIVGVGSAVLAFGAVRDGELWLLDPSRISEETP